MGGCSSRIEPVEVTTDLESRLQWSQRRVEELSRLVETLSTDTPGAGESGAPSEPLGIAADEPPYDHAQVEKVHAALIDAIGPVLQAHRVAPALLRARRELLHHGPVEGDVRRADDAPLVSVAGVPAAVEPAAFGGRR